MNNYELRVEYVEYVVKKGDSLYSISKMYDTSVTELIDINMLTSNTLFPGQVLLVPKKTNNKGYDYYTYSTIENDTIELISKKTNVDPVLLGLYNDFGKLKLQPGQVMNIPNSNVYIIKNDDTIDSILSNTNKSALELLKANETVWFKSGTKINL